MKRFLPILITLIFLCSSRSAFAGIRVQINSISPQSPEIGAKVKLAVELTGLTECNYFLVKVDIGKPTDSIEWYKGVILIYDPATFAFKSCGYSKQWDRDCAKFTVSSDTWNGEIEAQVPTDFTVGESVFRVRIRLGDKATVYTSNTVSNVVVPSIVENPQDNTTQPQNSEAPICPPGIILSEFMAYPNTDEQEWVEIYNANESAVTLKDWYIDDIEGGTTSTLFSAGIGGKSYWAIYLTDNKFNNIGGDSVRLLCPDKSVVDQYSYTVVTKNSSWAKDLSGNWQETTTPTPGGENKITKPAVAGEEKEAEIINSSENEMPTQTQNQTVGSSVILGENVANTETEGDILPDSASDYRPDTPPLWRVNGEVEATASEKIKEASSEASLSAGKNFSKGLIGGGALLSLGSLFYIVLTKYKQIPKN